jgi:hypothetical protein
MAMDGREKERGKKKARMRERRKRGKVGDGEESERLWGTPRTTDESTGRELMVFPVPLYDEAEAFTLPYGVRSTLYLSTLLLLRCN